VGPATPGADFLRGDANNDRRFDISDPIFTLAYAFQGATTPPCLDAADANDDGGIDISDAIYSLAYNFGGGNQPPAPFPGAGPDPTADSLSCGPGSSGMGTLLVGIHDTPPDALTEFWITIDEVTVKPAAGDALKVFPPASSPGAEQQVNLLDDVGFATIVASIQVPAGDYIGVHVEFDGAFARAGIEDVVVVPDSGEAHVSFTAPVTVTEGNLTALLIDFDLVASLADGGPGKVLLDPQLSADDDEEDDGEEAELNEFHGTVISVDSADSSFVVEVTARQCGHDEPAAVGQITVVVNDATEFEDMSGLDSLAAGQKVEVEGTLQDDGSVLAHEVELKGTDEGEDLDDDGIDDSNEGPDHDSDIDNDGIPNSEDGDDDGDDVEDGDDDDHDNDGVKDDDDGDDDDDCIEDGDDGDKDGDGIHNEDEDDSDEDGVCDDDDRDDDNDGVEDGEDDHDDGDDEDHEDDHDDGDDEDDHGTDDDLPPDPAA
jgi:hypothetical protein